MKRSAIVLAFLILGLALLAPPGASADEFERYEVTSSSASLSDYQAGAHADFTTEFALKTQFPDGSVAQTRDISVELPPGLIGNPTAVPTCSGDQLAAFECALGSQIGLTEYFLRGNSSPNFAGIYNMPPSGTQVARFGFIAGLAFPVTIGVRLRTGDYGVTASLEGIPSVVPVVSARTTIWGVPGDASHDLERVRPGEALPSVPRSSPIPAVPFLTNPTHCGAPLAVTISSDSYQLPGYVSAKEATMPSPLGCGSLEFSPTTTFKPTTTQGTTGSGLDYEASLPARGLEFPNLSYGSEAKRVEVTLPEGMTINPSEAEGLGVCSEEDLARETFDSAPNEGCPESSKIGSVEATTPVLDRVPTGSLYIAKPYQNPFGSLIALYLVVKVPDRGVLVKLAGQITTDPQTGQITTVFDDVPQLPVSGFKLHFREGSRAPLITPPACGSYSATSNFSPWSAPAAITTRLNSFQIESGPDHGPCPSGGTPPFNPGLLAGTLNNAAGSFSPFDVRLTRTDAEQEITHFSIKLPPGVSGKLAGIPYCSDAAIAAAKARERQPHGGEEELLSPSCPFASQIGTSLAGAGVGDVLAYVTGKVYLAGPYNGAPLSIVAITAAKAGPFDLGTVVVREALRVNPETAEVFVDATGSDPIPHIVDGIPVHLREIRVDVDRPEFALNPTNCEPTSTASTVLGSGTTFASESDDRPVTVTTRFQAADCASLGFAPSLKLQLKGGGTGRGGLPALKAVLTARPGDANIGAAQVTLPPSEFLEQGHLKNVCPRSVWIQGTVPGERCPANSIYGRAKAVTPLLSEPLTGPVYLRTGYGTRLPELVAALNGQQINIDVVGEIDSVHKKGSEVSLLRNSFKTVPDAPVTRFELQLKGGKKSLLVNSTNICKGTHKATALFTGQNGKSHEIKPKLQVTSCKHAAKGKKHRKGKTKGPKAKRSKTNSSTAPAGLLARLTRAW
jgi:hypothetical protein